MPAPEGDAPEGLVVVDKPPGWTSHDVVGKLRRLARTRRVGHAGTLDPMATGVLICGIGRATRLLGHLALTDKTYTATIRLGVRTPTDDAEGEVPASAAVSATDEAVVSAMADLTGDIDQVPSSVSAIKVNGQRAYARVRAGEDVELAARPVRVSRFELLARRGPDLDVVVDCSTGTYVRALARDLGDALGCGGHLTALRRTRVGPFRVEDAVPLETPLALATPAAIAIRLFPTLALTAAQAAALAQGKRLAVPEVPDAETVAAVAPDGW